MLAQEIFDIQKKFFSGFNQIAEPLIRAGFGNPILWPTGTIVVETIGRKSGRKIKIPVLATKLGQIIIFGTVRRNSQWVKNLLANSDVQYWFAGQPHQATAFVITPDQTGSIDDLPKQASCLAEFLQQQSRMLGFSFALLTPR